MERSLQAVFERRWIDGGGMLWLHPLLGMVGGLLSGTAAGAAYVRRDVL